MKTEVLKLASNGSCYIENSRNYIIYFDSYFSGNTYHIYFDWNKLFEKDTIKQFYIVLDNTLFYGNSMYNNGTSQIPNAQASVNVYFDIINKPNNTGTYMTVGKWDEFYDGICAFGDKSGYGTSVSTSSAYILLNKEIKIYKVYILCSSNGLLSNRIRTINNFYVQIEEVKY